MKPMKKTKERSYASLFATIKEKLLRVSTGVILIGIIVTILTLLSIAHQPQNSSLTYPSIHCIGSNQNFQCAKKHFEVLTHELGPKVATADLKQLYAHSPEIVSDCHQLAHTIGNTAVELYDSNISKAFLAGDSFCWSGYYHGVVERAVQHIGETQFVANSNLLCAAMPGKERYSFEYYNCVHGLGHGLMAIMRNDVFTSLPLCDTLAGDWERRSCYGGVFMENIMVDNRSHFSKDLKKDDLMYPCDAVTTPYKEQCYLMQTSYALSQTNYDFRGTFKLCSTVDEAFRETCAQSIGRDASGSSVSSVAPTVQKCSFALDDNQEKNCMIGAVKDFISYFHRGDEAQSLCFAFPERFKNDCLNTRASYLQTL
jgi:hypothetical protein